jgi:hypothetical protein
LLIAYRLPLIAYRLSLNLNAECRRLNAAFANLGIYAEMGKVEMNKDFR